MKNSSFKEQIATRMTPQALVNRQKETARIIVELYENR